MRRIKYILKGNGTLKTKIEDTQRAHVNFPLDLLAKLRESAKENRRSFTQEVMYRLEKSYALDNESKVIVEK